VDAAIGMSVDWPLIGAVGGLAVTVLVVGTGTAALLRSGPQEVRKTPASAPMLWSDRRPQVAPSPSPRTELWDVTTGSAPVPPPRERLVLFEEVATSTVTPEASARPARRPPAEPAQAEFAAAKPALAAPRKKVALAYAPAATPPPAAPKPQITPNVPVEPPKIVDRRYDGVLTMAEIARMKAGLRMTPDQMPLWPPVEAELRLIGRLQMAQVHAGQKPDVPQSEFQKLYVAARPLVAVMRPDQKERVRALARNLGYGSVASMI
jgi:hypothetical protein